MKIYVYHWVGEPLTIEGLYKEDKHYWLDVLDGELSEKLKELAQRYDVMFIGPTEEWSHFSIYLDFKGKRFRTR